MVLPEVTTLAEAQDAIRELAEENEKLSNELAWFRRQLFGSKTEHYIPRDDTPSLFPGGCFYSLSCREIHFVLVICFIQQYIICAIACKPCLLEGAITI